MRSALIRVASQVVDRRSNPLGPSLVMVRRFSANHRARDVRWGRCDGRPPTTGGPLRTDGYWGADPPDEMSRTIVALSR